MQIREEIQIEASVERPFYKTALFYSILVALVLGSFYYLFTEATSISGIDRNLWTLTKITLPLYTLAFCGLIFQEQTGRGKKSFLISSVLMAVLTLSLFLGMDWEFISQWKENPVARQTIFIAGVHYLLSFWGVLGYFYTRGDWKDIEIRKEYLKFSFAFLPKVLVVALLGGFLAAFTAAPFALADKSSDFLFSVLIFTAAGVPVIAFYLTENRKTRPKKKITLKRKESGEEISTESSGNQSLILLAFLAFTFFIYIVRIWGKVLSSTPEALIGGEIFSRGFLAFMDVIMVFVLGAVHLLLSKRGEKEGFGAHDAVIFALILTCVILDILALSGIVFRFTAYGFSPNRFAILVFNLAVMGNLIGIIANFSRFFSHKATIKDVLHFSVRYIDGYWVYAGVVAIFTPFLGQF